MNLSTIAGTLPTTNLSWVLAWLLVYLAAGHHYWTGEPPDGEWLMFIGAIFGAVVVQHGVKRFTYQPSPPGTLDIEDAPAEEPDEEEPARPSRKRPRGKRREMRE